VEFLVTDVIFLRLVIGCRGIRKISCGDPQNLANCAWNLETFAVKWCGLCRWLWLEQESIPVVDEFIVKYLETWNGVDHSAAIFALIPFMRLRPFAGRTLPVTQFPAEMQKLTISRATNC